MRARAAMVAAGLLVGALPLSPASADPRCDIELPGPERGRAAVTALGADLPAAAHAAGLTAARLERTLRTDPTLWVDECARPYYVEPADPAPETETTEPAAAEDALTLHSRPGSPLTLYLDFDGFEVADTVWSQSYGEHTAAAYSMDSDPAFNGTELARITGVWQRVAEDYAPLDVDVTTEDPGDAAISRTSVADTEYGTRVVITGSDDIYSDCSCGGIAYIGVFDLTSSHAYFQPAWVFTDGVGTGSKTIAEAASHEAGHNLGLRHDGTASNSYYTGQGAWAPIMGVGYYKPLSQWSRGEYTGANNTEDDLAVISNNGPPAIDDDGDVLDIAPGVTTGEITSPGDVDEFRFTATGTTTITVDPLSPGGDLDVALGIFNDDGTRVLLVDPLSAFVTSDSATGLAASSTLSLPTGVYTARVDGVGQGSALATGYSDYGSLGRYTLTLATTTPLLVHGPPGGTVGLPYSATLTASGGQAPYTFEMVSGALPPGLTLDTSGALAGAPTAPGVHTFGVRVTDDTGNTGVTSISVTIAPAAGPIAAPDPTSAPTAPPVPTAPLPAASGLRITTTQLPRARKGTAYRARLSATGSGALHWIADAVPRGLRMRDNGVLRGVPRRSGRYVITVAVREASGATARASLRLKIRR